MDLTSDKPFPARSSNDKQMLSTDLRKPRLKFKEVVSKNFMPSHQLNNEKNLN